jgi:leucine-rich PPR motif-containing protein, mitochondrial
MDRASRILNELENLCFAPTIEIFNSLITGHFVAKQHGKVNDILFEMSNRALSPNTVTYGALIAGWCKEGDLHTTYNLYLEMIEKGLVPNLFICSSGRESLMRQI